MGIRLGWLNAAMLAFAWMGTVSPAPAQPSPTSRAPTDQPPPTIVPVRLPTIAPTQIHLTAGRDDAVLRLTNERDAPVRFALTTFAWGMETDGSLRMEPTDRIRLSTDGVRLAPGETGEVRVVATGPRGDREDTYRIGVSEQVDERVGEPVAADGVQATASITLPVFHRPDGARPDGWLDARPAEEGALSILLGNRGTAHLFARDILVRGEDAEGRPLFTMERNGWYVLADDRREYRATLADDDCRRVRRLGLTAHLLDGSTLERLVETGALPCGGNRATGFAHPDGVL